MQLKTIKDVNDFNSETLIDINGRKIFSWKNLEFHIKVEIDTTNTVDISNCIFKEEVQFKGEFDCPISVIDCEFRENVSFNNAKFKGKVRIQNVSFYGKASFDNTTFNSLCDFWNTSFNKIVIFYKTDFLETVVFSRTHFHQNVLFTYTLIEKRAIFRGAIFKKGLDLSTSIGKGDLSLFDFALKKFDVNRNIPTDDEYEEWISSDGTISQKNQRETFRIIKKQLESQSNHIQALEYAALELDAREGELRETKYSRDGTKYQDLFILKLNRWSGRNGRSWLRGVAFTIIVSIPIFYLLILSTRDYKFGFDASDKMLNEISRYYFDFLTPTHRVDFIDSKGANLKTYVLDFTGRIFIAFGIFQTIQAFRKYRK